MFKNLIVSFLILPFLVVPLFCCCINSAQAATATVAHCEDSDHGSTTDHHKNSDTDHSHASCDCHSLSTAAENGSSIQIAIPHFSGDFFTTSDTLELGFTLVSKGSLRTAYLGPPGGSSAVPLYTLYHSLRI